MTGIVKMGKNTKAWLSKQKADPYYRKAKQRGYRARSAFKLLEIIDKHNILYVNGRFPKTILDLGAAPGAWIEIILEKYKKQDPQSVSKKFKVVGIDLTTIKPFDNPMAETHRCDIFKPKTEEILKPYGLFDVIVSDLAPKTAGDDRDIAIQEAMVERVFALLPKILKMHGNLVIKIFQSELTRQFVNVQKNNFRFVKLTKPNASRPSSKELYLVCKDYTG